MQDGINSFTCLCGPRYMGETCEAEYDPCAGSPCLAGGTCTRIGDQVTAAH